MRINGLFSGRAKGAIAAFSALALIGGANVGAASADPILPETATPVITAPETNAAVDTTPEAESQLVTANAFQAPTCEFTTWTPTPLQVNLTGDRLASYNNGNVVPMYGNKPASVYWAISPICGVRQVDGQPVAEWMYCTDAALDTCAQLDADGNPFRWDVPTNSEVNVGPTIVQATNPRLTDDQIKIVGYLLQHGIDWPTTFNDVGASTRTDNTTQANRQALQYAIWCVTDLKTVKDRSTVTHCDDYLSVTQQQAILELVPDVAQILELDRTEPTADEVEIGETAKFTLETDLVDQPLIATFPAGVEVEVCEGEATLQGSDLTVARTAEEMSTVVLCATSDRPGDVELMVSGIPTGDKLIHWNQADPECQVFATFDEQKQLASAATVTVLGDNDDDKGDDDNTGSGSVISGSLDTVDTGSLAIGSLALGSLGLGSLAVDSISDTGSAAAGPASTTTAQPQPTAPALSTSATPTAPAPSATTATSETPAGVGQVHVAAQPSKGALPHAINGGGAELSTVAKTGAGLALALLVIGCIGATVAVRRLQR